MLRSDIECFMKENNMKMITLIYNESDTIGIYCELKGGYLCDYRGHRVNRKKDIWGWLEWTGNGNAYRRSWSNDYCQQVMKNGFQINTCLN